MSTTTKHPSTHPPAPTPVVPNLDGVRDLVADALTQYAQTPGGRHRRAAGVSALDLAGNVRSWTHTTRLRDFVDGRDRRDSGDA